MQLSLSRNVPDIDPRLSSHIRECHKGLKMLAANLNGRSDAFLLASPQPGNVRAHEKLRDDYAMLNNATMAAELLAQLFAKLASIADNGQNATVLFQEVLNFSHDPQIQYLIQKLGDRDPTFDIVQATVPRLLSRIDPPRRTLRATSSEFVTQIPPRGEQNFIPCGTVAEKQTGQSSISSSSPSSLVPPESRAVIPPIVPRIRERSRSKPRVVPPWARRRHQRGEVSMTNMKDEHHEVTNMDYGKNETFCT